MSTIFPPKVEVSIKTFNQFLADKKCTGCGGEKLTGVSYQELDWGEWFDGPENNNSELAIVTTITSQDPRSIMTGEYGAGPFFLALPGICEQCGLVSTFSLAFVLAYDESVENV